MHFRTSLIFIAVSLPAAWPQSPPAPAQLQVPSATSRQVQLSWTASPGAKSYAIQRKSTDGYTTVLTATDVAATDKSIDPYTTYTYCVIAVNDTGQSACSNEMIVGPPPIGFNVVVPTNADTAAGFATLNRMEFDSNGDPALSFVNQDPNGDGVDDDDTLFFMSWSRARYAWNPPVQIAVVGPQSSSGVSVPVSLARDGDTDTWGLAYQVVVDDDTSRIHFATSSNNGVTWNVQVVPTSSSDAVDEPSLGMWHGSFYLAYHATVGLQYVTAKLSDPLAKWISQPIPLPGGYSAQSQIVSLQLDSAHNPGIAYLVSNDVGVAAAFWRPATGGSAIMIGHNDGSPGVDAEIALSFFGTQPRIVTDAMWNYDLWSQDYDHSVWAICGVGDGSNWLPAVNVPSDGNISISAPLTMASGSQGQTAVAMSTIHGGVGDGLCGFPKLSRSDDFLTFTTCAPAMVDNPNFRPPDYPVLKFWGNDKLWLAFHNTDANGQLGTGLVLWREP